ncbi:unnamed protein product [Phaedon cochleariae]|uniref:Uncharacterized protein n=1 Tax=Phaedon cochleariae TaxID=80249 RepID=A0A9N9WXZ5_PHACE|nr:unnamed protein product [Phaedon cochleariae]
MRSALFYLCIVSALICLASTQRNLTGEFRRAHQACQAHSSTRIDEDLMDRAAAGQPVDEYKLGNHLFCMYLDMGIMSRDKSINRVNLRRQLRKPVRDEAVIERIVRNCVPSGVHHGTSQQIAAELFRCVRRNLPSVSS